LTKFLNYSLCFLINWDSYPIPTSLLKQCFSVLLPTITKIINLSLSTDVFPNQFKSCSVHPHLKSLTWTRKISQIIRLISHLSFLSELAERIVELRLADHLSNNNFLNSFQSAYIKHHYTKITLLSFHNHLNQAMSFQQVTCLTLLDLSAAVGTIDHSVLLERLSSWFGITYAAQSWIKSYQLNRSIYANVENTKSSAV
jgi:Reverse transcriptase (RNA-dependent DNA polymerase)